MKYLVDTCALIWWLTDHPRLSGCAAKALNAPDSRLWITALSAYEMVQSFRKGRLQNVDDLLEGLEFTLRGDDTSGYQSRLKVIPLTVSACRVAALLKDDNGDPFDRLIAGQALEDGLTVITSDQFFKRVGVPVLW